MLDIIHGQTKNQLIASQLIKELRHLNLNGTLYIGYPVLATAEEKIEIDALLVTEEHNLTAILFGSESPVSDEQWDLIADQQDKVYFAIKNNLSRHYQLRSGRELGVEVEIITIFPDDVCPPEGYKSGLFCSINKISQVLRNIEPADIKYLKPLNAALQRVTTIKPVKKRENVIRQDSRGAVLKLIEKEIANLDQWQKSAAIETPEGPQRIRGLAGSGKTVVLALKAAYLQSQHPDWVIAITFYTRSLYQQIIDLIRRFSFEHQRDEPNWENLRVRHAWGSADMEGLYAEISTYCNVTPRNFAYGKSQYGMDDAFRGVCTELLSIVSNMNIKPAYDAILIDEAQDLNSPFFQLIYRLTKEPKRIIWAYDELQKLSESVMPSLDEMFGKDVVYLSNTEGQPREDIILPVCYRNTPWALTLAHALGFGIYRNEGLVQHFDEPHLWIEIGYVLERGDFSPGSTVTLKRDTGSYPGYFKELLSPDDAVISESFYNEVDQAQWVASNIRKNIDEDELEADDILIIIPDAFRAKQQFAEISEALARCGLKSHLAGVTTSRDKIFYHDSIAVANIFRSKGNEAPMVYIINSQYCFSGYELIKLRNILFTAITRCRAWVRISGFGTKMDEMKAEIKKVIDNGYRLRFNIPTSEELQHLRKIHRERTANEKAEIQKAEKGLEDFLKALDKGIISIDHIPLELRTAISKLVGAGK